MPTRSYRATVLLCAASWFLLGLHLSALHPMLYHGAAVPPTVLALISVFALVSVGALWRLLRASRPERSH